MGVSDRKEHGNAAATVVENRSAGQLNLKTKND